MHVIGLVILLEVRKLRKQVMDLISRNNSSNSALAVALHVAPTPLWPSGPFSLAELSYRRLFRKAGWQTASSQTMRKLRETTRAKTRRLAACKAHLLHVNGAEWYARTILDNIGQLTYPHRNSNTLICFRYNDLQYNAGNWFSHIRRRLA